MRRYTLLRVDAGSVDDCETNSAKSGQAGLVSKAADSSRKTLSVGLAVSSPAQDGGNLGSAGKMLNSSGTDPYIAGNSVLFPAASPEKNHMPCRSFRLRVAENSSETAIETLTILEGASPFKVLCTSRVTETSGPDWLPCATRATTMSFASRTIRSKWAGATGPQNPIAEVSVKAIPRKMWPIIQRFYCGHLGPIRLHQSSHAFTYSSSRSGGTGVIVMYGEIFSSTYSGV